MSEKFLISMLCFTAAGIFLTGSVFAAISGSDHDFSANAWSGGQVCNVCHTPHNAKVNSPVPLWNHATTAASYTLYSSSTLNASVAQPADSSKACLSCHDGTVAVDSFGTATGSYTITGNNKIGTDLSNDHPISFTYDAALAAVDPGLKNPDSSAAVKALLKGNLHDRVECSSCHDVHNSAGINGLLVKSNAASALCLTCHTK